MHAQPHVAGCHCPKGTTRVARPWQSPCPTAPRRPHLPGTQALLHLASMLLGLGHHQANGGGTPCARTLIVEPGLRQVLDGRRGGNNASARTGSGACERHLHLPHGARRRVFRDLSVAPFSQFRFFAVQPLATSRSPDHSGCFLIPARTRCIHTQRPGRCSRGAHWPEHASLTCCMTIA